MGIESIFAAWMELYFLWDPQWLHSPSASRPQRHSPHHRSCPAKSYHEHLGPAGGLVQCELTGRNSLGSTRGLVVLPSSSRRVLRQSGRNKRLSKTKIMTKCSRL